ncbi:MAG: flavodoxin family protein [Anaerovoracaceae bacterium]
MEERKTVIIHDLPEAISAEMFSQVGDDVVVIDARAKAARCVGCFNCWLKTPGVCTFADSLEHIGQLVLSSKKLILISEMLYGGLSVPVKRVIDRSIPGVTPFFKKRFGKLHHLQRYKTQTAIQAIFYNTQGCTEEERRQSEEYIEAMGINYYAEEKEVVHLPGLDFSGVKE